ncbi:calcium-binding protein [cf. Phormidesmis sp. LEGE 11477]|uniref:calcium-binding protein n=1 Tax=cf. Phormidesmis sp. LEGE 11477 TaxID=1828680 RepID=UPI0018800EDC|nr:calcium-binding protein [cf. Phormidesmis sp. LEGE 11477]MBE9064118.1 calcium-binding protein [cf. Phormidesmis sp. LEGE 11477]
MPSSIRLEFGLAEFDRNPRYEPKYITEFPFVGGRGNDTFLGDGSDNKLIGRRGNDLLLGGAGSDVLIGGKGEDELFFDVPFSWNPAPSNSKGVFADLNKGRAVDYFGDVDKLISIEHVWGTQFSDELIGSRAANDIAGGSGDDKIFGLGGDDLLYGGLGKDFLIGGRGRDQFLYLGADEGGDRIEGFKSGVDEFLISSRHFSGVSYPVGSPPPEDLPVGTLSNEMFFLGSSAQNDDQLFGYNPTNSTVVFDSNGKKRGGVQVLATLSRGSSLAIEASDINIFAPV